jgi:hypothetical protein
MRLYNAVVKPHLTYNAAYTGKQVEALDRLHRRQLRRVLNVYYPAHISNAEVYERTGAHPISIDIAKMRWSFFGHVLRQPLEIPANRFMKNYYKRREEDGGQRRVATQRSRCLTTVPRLLQKDLSTLSPADRTNFFGGATTLSTGLDLEKLRRLAQNRPHRKKAVGKITEAAESKWGGGEQIGRRRAEAVSEQGGSSGGSTEDAERNSGGSGST